MGGRPSSDRLTTLSAARESLQSKIELWSEDARGILPSIQQNGDGPTIDADFEEDLEDVHLPQQGPELALLGLPSDIEECSWTSESTLFADLELRLRIGHAYDLLSSVRMSVRKKAALIQDKSRNAHGTKDNLRSQQLIMVVQDHVNLLAESYNGNFLKMQYLATTIRRRQGRGATCQEDNLIPAHLRLIDLKSDLHVPSLRTPRNLGDSKRTVSWIYQVAGPHNQSQAVWENESE